MAENRELCSLSKRENAVIFKESDTLLYDLGNLLFLVGIKCGGAAKVALIIFDVSTHGIAANTGRTRAEEFFKDIIEFCK